MAKGIQITKEKRLWLMTNCPYLEWDNLAEESYSCDGLSSPEEDRFTYYDSYEEHLKAINDTLILCELCNVCPVYEKVIIDNVVWLKCSKCGVTSEFGKGLVLK